MNTPEKETKKTQEWMEVLSSLNTFPPSRLFNEGTVIVDDLHKLCSPNHLLGFKHGVVFTPKAMLQAMELSAHWGMDLMSEQLKHSY